MKALTPGLELGSRFVLLRRIAEGGSSEVWLAEDRELERRVALKVFDDDALAGPGARARLETEIGLARSMPAGEAVGIIGLHEADGLTLLEMEYLPGGDLGQFRGRPFAAFAQPLQDVAQALAGAHQRGLVHRDLKCGNVLLDAAGRVRLADFGLATLAGARPAGGSPYNMSPQQLRGEGASPADDLYAFGAMLYELLAGQPPYYPDITRDRVLHEPVPPLVPRSPAPARARQLALKLLAKSAAARPASMQEVREELAQALVEPEEAAIGPRVSLPPPQPPAGAGAAQGGPRAWRGAAAAALVALLGLAFVFVWLPGEVEQRAAAARQQATADATADVQRLRLAQVDSTAREEAGAAAEKARDAWQARLSALESQAAAAWATEALAAARSQGAAAAQRFALGEFEAAQQAWVDALAALTAIEAGRPAALAAALQAGNEALASGQSGAAKRAFTQAQAIEGDNAAAAQGLARAATLDEVFALLDQAALDERSGRANAARDGYRRALELDSLAPGAREALERIGARQASDAFAAAMSRGLAALAEGRFVEAKPALEQARALRPGSREVADALAELERSQRAAGLQDLSGQALAAEREERWEAARIAWAEALKREPTLAPASAGLERVAPRIQLDAQIDGLLASPELLWTERGRTAARSAIATAADAAPPRNSLAARAAQLAQLLAASETPVRLMLESDGVTEVVIYRVGRMGAFQRREVELLPGRYAVVGTRPGFRDVRRDVEIPPGGQPAPVKVSCEEPI